MTDLCRINTTLPRISPSRSRTWMRTMMMMMMITLQTTGRVITLLPPLVGMIPGTTRSLLLTCAQTVTPMTILRAPMSTAGRALCRAPCLCEETQRRQEEEVEERGVFVCKYVCVCDGVREHFCRLKGDGNSLCFEDGKCEDLNVNTVLSYDFKVFAAKMELCVCCLLKTISRSVVCKKNQGQVCVALFKPL